MPEADQPGFLGTDCWVTSGFIGGKGGWISPSSPVPALAKLMCCLEDFSGADLKKTGKLATYFLVLTGVYSVESLYTDCCVAMVQGSGLQLQMRKLCCFVTLLSRKELKILLLAFIITAV